MIYAVYARDPRRNKVYYNVTNYFIQTGSVCNYAGVYDKKFALKIAKCYKNKNPGDNVKIIGIRRNNFER